MACNGLVRESPADLEESCAGGKSIAHHGTEIQIKLQGQFGSPPAIAHGKRGDGHSDPPHARAALTLLVGAFMMKQ
jgi:hypothetical protein